MKYYIKTYGCQANKNESERRATHYEKKGYKPTLDWHEADLIFLNTCSVRKAADDRVYALLNQFQEYFKNKKKKPRVYLTGCMARYGEKLTQKYWILTKVLMPGSTGFADIPKRQDKNQAFVQISTGCNSFCTYCVVPYARGREQSRSQTEILNEIHQAVTAGYHEITLLGQNVNSWGLEKVSVISRKKLLSNQEFTRENLPHHESAYLTPTGTPPFVTLLQEISKITQVEKIRFMTSNPWDFYDELIAEIGKNKKIDRFLHLPVQSGSNDVLKRMNRGYTREDYLNLIKKLRNVDPNITFGTDIIVGFSGETEEDFAQTVDLVNEVGFLVGFVAMYSQRSGTVAAKLFPDDIPHVEKKRRFEILDKIINKDNLDRRPKIV